MGNSTVFPQTWHATSLHLSGNASCHLSGNASCHLSGIMSHQLPMFILCLTARTDTLMQSDK
ncbi:MAG: hypothetical protein HDS84_00525 [Bacteroidales bacterium]|nr:hypothetical protein [Bacteroidales bacterium]